MNPTLIFQNYPVYQDGLIWRINTDRWEMLYLLADYLTAEGFEWSSVIYFHGVETGIFHKTY